MENKFVTILILFPFSAVGCGGPWCGDDTRKCLLTTEACEGRTD